MPARRSAFSLLLVALLMIGSVAYGQAGDADDAPPHPLIAMLAHVPATNAWVAYADYRAIWSVNAPVLRVTSARDLRVPALAEPWFYRSWRVADSLLARGSSPETLLAVPDTVGFDFFDIHQVMQFNTPPNNGVAVSGAFDPDAVIRAYLNRGYEQVEVSGVMALCPAGDCSGGILIDLQGIEPGNIFDYLGRKPPLLLLDDGTLISAPAEGTLNRVASVAGGRFPALLDSPDHQAIAAALTDPELFPGALLQAHFLPPDLFSVIDLSHATHATDDGDDEWLSLLPGARIPNDYGSLPPHFRVAIADYEDSQRQKAVIALVYTDQEMAQIAAEEVARRLATFAPRDLPPFVEQIDGAQIDPPVIYETPDRVVALISVSYPLFDERLRPPPALSGGQMYLWWYRALLLSEFTVVQPLLLPQGE